MTMAMPIQIRNAVNIRMNVAGIRSLICLRTGSPLSME